jgi:ribosome-binding protein aMBF1 (putative translation factor)
MPPLESALRKFGDNVRARREAQGFSQEKLAELADLDRTYIGGIERREKSLKGKPVEYFFLVPRQSVWVRPVVGVLR